MNWTRIGGVASVLVGGVLCVQPAMADDVFGEAGFVDVLPVAPVPGDGATVADLFVIALNADGSAMTELKAKLTATSGTVGELSEVAPGLYTAQFTPPAVDEATDVTVTVRTVKTKAPLTVNAVVPVAARGLDEVKAAANPETMVLGKDDGASLTLAGVDDLVSAVSAGKVSNVTKMPGGQITARYEPPRLNFPQLALITVADAADPLGTVGHVVVPLHGKVPFPVTAPEGASVILEIAGKKFGPVKAGEDGQAKVPVEVPPGVNEAVQAIVNGDDSTKETIDLQIPATTRLQLFPLPEALPADEGRQVPLRVLVATVTGGADEEAAPTFEVSSGSVGKATHVSGGVYRAMWTLGGDPGEATVKVEVGDRKVDLDEATVTMHASRPVKVDLAIAPETLDSKHTLTATVTPDVGTWSADVTGGTLSASGANDGAGTWTSTVTPAGKGDLVIDTWVDTVPSPNPVAGVVIVPARTTAPMDGVSATTVFVAAVDAFGTPVPATKVTLKASGPGTLPGSIETDDDGVSTVVLASGKEAGLTRLTATVGDHVGVGAVLHLPRGTVGPALPAAGTERAAGLAQRWLDTTPGLRLTRGGSAAAAVAPAVVGATATRPAASPAALLVTVPDAVPPGSQVPVSIEVLDDAGESLDTLPEVTAEGAEVGEVTLVDGMAKVVLTVADDAEGPIQVTVTAGEVSETSEITVDPDAEAPVLAAAAAGAGTKSAWGAVVDGEDGDDGDDGEDDDDGDDDDGTADEDDDEDDDDDDAVADAGAASDAVVTRPEAGDADVPWLRARASAVGSTYRYTQAPSAQPGPLLPSTLAVGGPDGGDPASPVGFELDARGWGDELADLPYVGVHTQFRMTSYGISASEFANVASDLMYNVEVDLLGRYPFESGGDLYWVGGKAGFHYNDFILFTGCLEPSCQVNFEPLAVPGLALGAELGAEVMDLYLIAGYTFGLAQFSKPYSNAVDINVGYGFLDNAFADLGLSMLTRQVLLEGQDSGLERGEINDSHLMLKAGVGFQM